MFPLWTTSPESAVSSFHRLILDWRWFLMMWRCARNFLILIVSEVLPPFVFHRHSISRRCGSWETHSQGWKLGKLSKGEMINPTYLSITFYNRVEQKAAAPSFHFLVTVTLASSNWKEAWSWDTSYFYFVFASSSIAIQVMIKIYHRDCHSGKLARAGTESI